MAILTPRARAQAIFELCGAGALWGFGFVAAMWALRGMGPLAITGWRFVLATVAGFALIFAFPAWRSRVNREVARLSIVPGLLISATLILQTWGLKYTTATKSGFITTLYVLMVPLMERFWLKKRLGRWHGVAVALALIGVALICDLPGEYFGTAGEGRMAWNIGDVLTFLCAICASLHILWFGLIQERIGDPFVFNSFQSFWAGVPALVLAVIFEPITAPSWGNLSLQGLLMLAFGSSLIAFALQAKAQKVLSPSFASLLFLLESPFGTFFGVILLGESLAPVQWAGAGLILIAAGLSTAMGTES